MKVKPEILKAVMLRHVGIQKRIKQEAVEMEKDAARFAWIADNDVNIERTTDGAFVVTWQISATTARQKTANSLRAAIDAAMEANK